MIQKNNLIHELLSFFDDSPTAWHAVDRLTRDYRTAGMIELKEEQPWQLEAGKSYFVTRNGSSVCAFTVPKAEPQRVRLLASHTDSPSLKLKRHSEVRKQGTILFGVEIYGGPLLSSWLNRDLGLAGRVIVLDENNRVKEHLVNLTKYLMTIPQLAIHLDREVNEKGLLLNKQEHLYVLAALDDPSLASQSYLERILKEEIAFNELISFDLFFYPLEKARLLGYQEQLIASYRIDSLASVHAASQSFLQNLEPLDHDIKMIVFWDNEEIGSNTAHGASSPFIAQIIERILTSLKLSREDYFRLISQSLCISIDLAHATHPNYTEKHDAQHPLWMGKGIAIKSHANQRYASDARSSASLQLAAKKENIPLQYFASRNDLPCGTTIGPIHATLLGMPTVDIGCTQLSMHSSRELMATQDYIYLCQLLRGLLDVKEMKSLLPD